MTWTDLAVTAVLIGVATNFDNTGVGLAYGADNLRFPHRINALVNTVGFAAVLTGSFAGGLVAPYLPEQAAADISCGVLVGVGLLYWYLEYIRPLERGHKSLEEELRPPGWRSGVVLGFGLSATNVANGFGATVLHRELLWPVVISVTAFGYLAIWAGNVIGIDVLSRWLGRYAAFVAGLLLVSVGIHELFS